MKHRRGRRRKLFETPVIIKKKFVDNMFPKSFSQIGLIYFLKSVLPLVLNSFEQFSEHNFFINSKRATKPFKSLGNYIIFVIINFDERRGSGEQSN